MSRFPFSKSQVTGTVLVCLFIVITFVCLRFMPRWQSNRFAESLFRETADRALAFEQRLQERQKTVYQTAYAATRDTVRLVMQPFDPNTADSITLRQLGMPEWMVSNVQKYRAAGGVFRRAASFRKVYGMTDSLYSRLSPYIRIDTMAFRRDTVPQLRYVSLKKDTVLDLNRCDTAELKYIRGIGSYTARQIVRYRQELGGYVSVRQLGEIPALKGKADTLMSCFVVSPDAVRRLPVNRSRAETLSRHPYLTFEQARAIYEHRRMQFRLHSIDDLRSLPCFTDSLLNRIEPYLSFEE